ncbi:hypothetical protein F2Q68_00040073 [Brassica cretica]|uniref:Uncharacterized protein n=2 Tax=Brassica cretica TaxID=69181 RepID=A0A8S9MCG3_BRACR|nr:hypothetical protein F2Q68_00040073 [Brassica cretica]KAF3497004.1 hypothetical protein DY000_02053715 [Brassica cretica]
MEDYDNGAVDGLAYPSDELFCNFLDGQASGSSAVQTDPPGFENFTPDFDGFFDFRLPSTGLHLVTEALKVSRTEARTALFKAEVAEKELARLKEEAAANSLREKELAAKEARRAYRKGKREVADIMKNRFTEFSNEFGELSKTYKSVANYRKCRGAVGRLYLTQVPEYSYKKELAKQTRRMDRKANMVSMIPQIEGRIWDQWAPIPVSPDSEEVKL